MAGNVSPAALDGAAAKRGAQSGVAVRLARNQANIEAMIALGRLLHAESRFRTLPLDDARMREIGRRGLVDGNPGLLMAELGDELVGMAGHRHAGRVLLLPRPHRHRSAPLRPPETPRRPRRNPPLRALRSWAAKNGAHDLHVNVTTGIDAARTDRFLRKMGFRQTGGNYVLEGG